MKLKKLLTILSIFALLITTINLNSMKIIAATVPSYSKSYYIGNISGGSSLGQQTASSVLSKGLTNALVILDFGGQTAAYLGSTLSYPGTQLVGGTASNVTINQITSYVQNFLSAFWVYAPASYHIILGVGTNNSLACAYVGGQIWAQMINNINSWISTVGYGSREIVYGANDMENNWSSASLARQWVDGYNSIGTIYLYDYGDCNGTWSQDDNAYVAYNARWSYPIPEIYFPRTPSYLGNADYWSNLSIWNKANKGVSIAFPGVMTQYACDSTSNYPTDGWTQLYNLTGQAPQYLTDISW